MKIHGRLGFELREQTQDKSEFFDDFNLNIVKDWLHEQPNSNQGVMAKSMYEFLLEFNRTQVCPQTRYEVLETLLPQMTYLTQKMAEHYLEDTLLPHDKKRKISLLIEALSLEICMGFKIIIEELANSFRKNKPLLTKCLHHLAVLYLELLQKSYQMYSNPPPSLWKELHLIYQVSDKYRVLNKEVEHFDARPIRHTIILDAYKHALLLACANPFRLRGPELYKINFALEYWAPMLSFSKRGKQDSDVFIVDLSVDGPPHHARLAGEPSKNSFALNLDKINERIAKVHKLYNQDDDAKSNESLLPSEYHLPMNVIKFLMTSWTQIGQRGSDRIAQAGHVRVTLGLKAAFAAIQAHLDEEIGPTITTVHEETQTEEIYFDNVPLPQQSEQSHQLDYAFLKANLVNISTTGLCLEFLEPFDKDLKTGEIIAIEQNPENECQLSIGMICWMKQIDAKRAQCGIKLLSPYAQPILSIIPEQKNPLGVKTLLLPAEPSFQPFITLITPALPFKEGTSILVAYGDDTYTIFLENVIESSSSFNQFHIQCQDGQDLPFLKFNHAQNVDEYFRNIDLS